MAEHEFAVWAPRPERVRLDVDGTLHPMMTRSDDGWWRADVDARPDARYGFVLDDDDEASCRIRARPASPTVCTSARSCGDPSTARGATPAGRAAPSRAR